MTLPSDRIFGYTLITTLFGQMWLRPTLVCKTIGLSQWNVLQWRSETKKDYIPALKLKWPLKIDDWKIRCNLLLRWSLFKWHVTFWGCMHSSYLMVAGKSQVILAKKQTPLTSHEIFPPAYGWLGRKCNIYVWDCGPTLAAAACFSFDGCTGNSCLFTEWVWLKTQVPTFAVI